MYHLRNKLEFSNIKLKSYILLKQSSQITRDFIHYFQLIYTCFSLHKFLEKRHILKKQIKVLLSKRETNEKTTDFWKYNFQQNCCRQSIHDEPVHNQLQSLCEKKHRTTNRNMLVCYITKDARNGWVNANDGIHERKFLTHSVIIMSWNLVRNQFRVNGFKKTSSNQK